MKQSRVLSQKRKKSEYAFLVCLQSLALRGILCQCL